VEVLYVALEKEHARMGMVHRPTQPSEETPEKHDEPQDEGTIGQARVVEGDMEHLNSPRSNRFDPTKADASTLIPLQSLSIAKPCRADWDKMEGDDKSRFCQTCQKSVYNLSAMTTSDAEKLLAEKNGDLCARIYRRADGTVITGDCPVGQKEARRPFWWLSAGFAALMGLGAMLGGGASGATTVNPPEPTMGDVAVQPASVEMGAAPAPPVLGRIICPPTPKPKPTEAPKPKPTAAPEMGEPTMGKPAIPKQP
jgi:hypothetical protein